MERVLIVNADDFGLSKGQNYGIVEAYRKLTMRRSLAASCLRLGWECILF